jgi:Tat protein translocase TatB subunit
MFDIGLQELALIFVIALLVFGPKNLPQLGRSLGRAMREFRRASDEFRSTIETNLKINELDPIPDPTSQDPTPGAAPSDPGTEPVATAEALPEAVLNPYDAAPTPVPEGEAYLAQRSAKLFHGRDCSWARRIAESERVYFKRVAEAREAGYAACPVCEPWERAG